MTRAYFASGRPVTPDVPDEMPVAQHRVIVIDSNHCSAQGLNALLTQMVQSTQLLCSLGSVNEFFALPVDIRMRMNTLIMHPDSLEGRSLAAISFLSHFLHRHPDCRVLVMTSMPSSVLSAIYRFLGVTEILPARSSLQTLQMALHASLTQKEPATTTLPQFTERELIALQGLLAGEPVAKQACQMGVSLKTLYSQRNSALKKMGLRALRDVFRR